MHPASKYVLWIGMMMFAAVSARGQGSFQNLDFEAATVPTNTPSQSLVPVTQALPSWAAYVGGVPQTQILYNSLYLGTAIVSLQGPGSPAATAAQGSYMAILQAGQGGSAAIAQTATIPSSAKTLFFTASPPYAAGWSVTIGGIVASVVPIASFGTFYEIYGIDISALAGQTEELRFTAIAGSGPTVNMALDDINFSQTMIPEPTTWSLLGLGAGMGLLKFKIERVIRGKNG